MNKSNWDDLRFVLAVAETGSVNQAGKRLAVTHATVLRRVAAFEDSVGQPIFQKSSTGYKILPGKQRLIENARRIQEVMLAIESDLNEQADGLSGTVRITSTDSLSQLILPGMVGPISMHYPGLKISILSANKHLDFETVSAEIAIRPALKLETTLVGDVVARLGFSVYEPRSGADKWIGPEGAIGQSQPAVWMANNVSPADIIQSADSYLVLQNLAAEGIGRCFLPCFIGDADTRLKRCDEQPPAISVPIWVGVQRELKDTAPVRIVSQLLIDEFRKIAPKLSGGI